MALTAVEIVDPQLREAIGAAADDEVVGEGVDALERPAGRGRDEGRPVGEAWVAGGGGHHLEVRGAVVGADEEAVGVVVERVVDALGAFGDEREWGVRVVGGEEMGLAGGPGGGAHDEERVAAGAGDAEVEPRVVLLMHQDVGGVGADAVAVELVGGE